MLENFLDDAEVIVESNDAMIELQALHKYKRSLVMGTWKGEPIHEEIIARKLAKLFSVKDCERVWRSALSKYNTAVKNCSQPESLSKEGFYCFEWLCVGLEMKIELK